VRHKFERRSTLERRSHATVPSPARQNGCLGEGGQTLVLFVLFMFTVLGMAGLSIDVGHWYQERQAVQAEADASALAGASQLPTGWSNAVTAASSNVAKNAKSGDSPTYTNTTNQTAHDSVTVTITRQS
jgi:uncharacterized membrane protein